MSDFLSKNFLGCDHDLPDADVVLFGAPYDGTSTFRPGSRFAPSKMRMDSIGLETYSPYFDMDICDFLTFDAGDLDLPFGNTEKVLDIISDFSKSVFDKGKKPLMIGGEHLLSLPVIKNAFLKYKDLKIIHFDAHTDLRDDYLGEKLSHSTVMKRVWEFIGDGKIYQYGIRSGTRDEFAWAKNHTCLNPFTLYCTRELSGIFKDAPVYLSIDLDVLDPSVFPGTGTPEPGGVDFSSLLAALKDLAGLNIIGADLMELSPPYDFSGISTAAALKTLRELLILLNLSYKNL